jgi:ribonucleoside-diphosphate reductase alpha chain
MTEQQRLPDERISLTVKLEIPGEIDGYVHLGAYPDGRIGEVGIVFGQKHGDAMRGLLDAISTAVSIALQHGAPLQTFVQKFSHTKFPPCGATSNDLVPNASSILDLIFRWIGKRFPDGKIHVDSCDEKDVDNGE